MYHRSYVDMYWDIYHELFPFLWPLQSLGNKQFKKFQTLAKLTTLAAKTVIVVALITVTISLPWFGDDYDILLPVKIAMDNFDGWLLKTFLILFYSTLYHGTLTVVANVFCQTYLVLHLFNQLCMLKVRLSNLGKGPDLPQAIRDKAYQDFVKTELISCIKLHQVLLRYYSKLVVKEILIGSILGTRKK